MVIKVASEKRLQPATGIPAEAGSESLAAAPAVSPPPVATPSPVPASPLPPSAVYLKFKCPNCERMIGFPAGHAARPAVCPKCNTRVMVIEKEGEESFIVGALSQEHKVLTTPRMPAPPVTRPHPLRRTAMRFRIAVKEMPRWKTALTAIGCTAALVLAAILIVNEFRNGQGPQNSVTSAAETPPPSVTPVQSPGGTRTHDIATGPVKEHDAVEASRTPTAGANETPTGTTEPVVIRLRPDAAAEDQPVKPMALINLDRNAPSPKALDDEEEQATIPRPATATIPSSPSQAKGDPGSGDPVLKLIEKVEEKKEPAEVPAVPEKVPEIIGLAPSRPAENIAPAPMKPPAPMEPPVVCAACQGTSFVPLPLYKPYIWNHKDPAPDPQTAVPYAPCPKCQGQQDIKALATQEAERMRTAPGRTAEWPRKLNTVMECGETRFVSLAAQMSPASTRCVLQQLDKLTQVLQQNFRSMLLTQTRPDRHELVIVWDQTAYERLIDMLAAGHPTQDWSLARRADGCISRERCIFNAQRGQGVPPEHRALFQFAHMLVIEGTQGRSPDWLTEGFASYCENTMFKKNLCYAFRYELNQVRLGINWNAEIAPYARAGQLQPWDRVFKLDLIGMKAIDYLTCYSIVRFLAADPGRFNTLLVDIRAGMDSPRAVEHAYGRTIGELQQLWAQWALRQR